MTGADVLPSNETSIRKILITHFDAHQRYNQEDASTTAKKSKNRLNSNGNVSRRVHMIRRDVSAYLSSRNIDDSDNDEVLSKSKNNKDNSRNSVEQDLSNVITKMSSLAVIDDVQEDVSSTILHCVEASFIEVATRSLSKQSKDEDWEESVNRTLELAAVLSSSMKESFTLCTILSRIEYCSKAAIDNVRIKACYFLELCLKALQASFNDKENGASSDLWKKQCMKQICPILLPRLTDKALNVRMAAIKASKYIFHSSQQSKSIIKEFVKIQDFSKKLLRDLVQRLNHDSTITCRIEALHSVPICKKMVRYIIDRIRDVKEKVRITALEILSKVDVRLLTVDQRCTILRSGLTARCDSTRDATIQLICCGWMKSAKFNPIIFLRLLDVANNDKMGEMAMRQIISIVIDDDKTAQLKELSEAEISSLKENVLCSMDVASIKGFIDPEYILFMHCRCAEVYESKSLSMAQKQEVISELMYDVPTLIEALEEHLKCYIDASQNPAEDDDKRASLEDSHWFVCLRLLKLAEYADLQEAGSRTCFTASLHNILCSFDTPDGLVEEIIKAFKFAYTSESDFMDAIADMIQYISEEAAHNSSPSSVDVFDFDDENNSPNNDVHRLAINSHLTTVNILSHVLEHLGHKINNISVWDKFLDPIVTATTSPNHQLREIGVTCLGRFALLSDGEVVNNDIMPCLQTIANNDDEVIEVRAKAAMAICDLVLLFDTELSTSLEDFSSLLFSLFDHDETGFVCVASEICVKLLLAGTLKDEAIIARLLVIFFTDKYDDDKDDEDVDDITEIGNLVRLNQLLSMFFPAYCMKSAENREIITKSIQTVLSLSYEELRTQKNAVKSNIVLINKVINYTFSLISMGEEHMAQYQVKDEEESNVKGEQVTSSNLSTMIIILDFIINYNNLPPTYVRTLCKIVAGIFISGKEETKQIRKFHKQVEEVEDLISDKTALNTIQKLYDTLSPLDYSETQDSVDQTMISQINNISLIEPNEANEIQNISLNVSNINNSSNYENASNEIDLGRNIMNEEHDSSFEI